MSSNRGQKRTLSIPGLTPPAATAGGGKVPTAADIAFVKKHPETLQAFKAHFGINP